MAPLVLSRGRERKKKEVRRGGRGGRGDRDGESESVFCVGVGLKEDTFRRRSLGASLNL
jgi:hypothetical protein